MPRATLKFLTVPKLWSPSALEPFQNSLAFIFISNFVALLQRPFQNFRPFQLVDSFHIRAILEVKIIPNFKAFTNFTTNSNVIFFCIVSIGKKFLMTCNDKKFLLLLLRPRKGSVMLLRPHPRLDFLDLHIRTIQQISFMIKFL